MSKYYKSLSIEIICEEIGITKLLTFIGDFVVAHVTLVEIITASRTFMILVKPGHNAVNMEVMATWKEEDFASFIISITANSTHLTYTTLFSNFYWKLLHVFILNSILIFDLLVIHFIDNIFVGIDIHSIYWALSFSYCVLCSKNMLLLILIIHPIQIIYY